jgi:hypothetical protein
MYLETGISIALLAATVAAHFVVPNDDQNMSGIVVNGISARVREKYMRLVGCIHSLKISRFGLNLARQTRRFSSKVDPVPSPLTELSSSTTPAMRLYVGAQISVLATQRKIMIWKS